MPESEKTVVVGMTPDALAGTISQAIGGSGGRYDSLPEYFDQMQATLESIDEGVMTIYDAVVDRFASMGGSVAPDGTTGGLAVPFAVPDGTDAFSAFLEAVREGVRSANESYALAAEGNESAAGAAQRAAESAERVAEGSGAVAEATEKVAEAGDKAAEASSRSARAHGRAAEAAEAAAEAAEQADGPVGRFGEATDRVLARLRKSLSTAAEDVAKSNEELSRIQAQLDELGDGADQARVAELERARRKAEVDRLEAEYRVAQVNAQTAYAEGDEAAYRSAMDDVRTARGAYEQASSAYEAEGQPRRSGATTALDWLQYATGDVLDNAPRMWRDIDRGNYGDLANVLGSLTQGAGDLLGGGGSISQKILGGGVGAALSFASKALPFVGGLATTLGAYGNFKNYWDESNRMAAQYGMQGMPEFALARAGMGLQSMWTGYTTGLSAEQAQRIQTGIMAGGADFGTQEYQQGYDFVVDAYRNTGMSAENAMKMYVDQVLRGSRSIEDLNESLESMQEAVDNTGLTFDEMQQKSEKLVQSVSSATGGNEQLAEDVATNIRNQLGMEGVSEQQIDMYSTRASKYNFVDDMYAASRLSDVMQANPELTESEALIVATQSLTLEGYKPTTDFQAIMMMVPNWAQRSLLDMMREASQYTQNSDEMDAIFAEMVDSIRHFLAGGNAFFSDSKFRRCMRQDMGVPDEFMGNPEEIAASLLGFVSLSNNVSNGQYRDTLEDSKAAAAGEAGATKDFADVPTWNPLEETSIWTTLSEATTAQEENNTTGRNPNFSALRNNDVYTAIASKLYREKIISEDDAKLLQDSPEFGDIMDGVVDAYAQYVRDVINETPEGQEPMYYSIYDWLGRGSSRKAIETALVTGDGGKSYSSLYERLSEADENSQANLGQAYFDRYTKTSEYSSPEEYQADVEQAYRDGLLGEDDLAFALSAIDYKERNGNSAQSGTRTKEQYEQEKDNGGVDIASEDVSTLFQYLNMNGIEGGGTGDFLESNTFFSALSEDDQRLWKEQFKENEAFSSLSEDELNFITETVAPLIYNQIATDNVDPQTGAPPTVNVAIDLLGDAGELFYAIVESVKTQADRNAAKE